MPSLADAFFVVVVYVLAFSPMAAGLLNDADTGWHIRNGEHILRTVSIPRTDYFSYTMAGHPWYAWEWFYDAIIGAIHIYTGLNGVTLFSALVIASTFALLFQLLLRRSGSVVFSLVAAMLALLSAQVHTLARPHILSWLMTVVWLWILSSYQERGQRWRLFLLPPLMLLWVNVHGGFLIGLVLVGIFVAGELWTNVVATDTAARVLAKTRVRLLVMTGFASTLVTFATPYGYKLYLHIAVYLSNRYFMDHIDEFRSPNFHAMAGKWFEALVLLVLMAAVFSRKRGKPVDFLLVAFAVYSALYAARNIPISAILLSYVAARWLAAASDECLQDHAETDCMGRILPGLKEFSTSMERLQRQFRGHLLPMLLTVAAIAISLNGGRVGNHRLLAAHFDETRFPARAVDFVAAHGIRDHMFNADDWGGYLLYRLPQNKVFFDDRHDFYGEAFVREFMRVAGVQYGWREVLNKYRVKWILLPVDASVTNALKETSDWKPIYDDGHAIIFARQPEEQGGKDSMNQNQN
jgi:hypothetical protein